MCKETNEWWLIEVSYRLFSTKKKSETEKGSEELKETVTKEKVQQIDFYEFRFGNTENFC